MASSSLVTHCGARTVTREELEKVVTPPCTDTWFPLPHAVVLSRVEQTLRDAAFEIRSTNLALARDNARFFATLDLATPLTSGVSVAVGIRNSTDRSLPISFCAGSRVFVCDNLCFTSELVVNRKHTRFGETRFNEAICRAVQSLNQYQVSERGRIQRYERQEIKDVEAEAMMLRSYDKGIISHRLLPRVIKEWRSPSFEEFQPRTVWSLENAFTTVLADVGRSNPQRFCALTIALQGLLSQTYGPAQETPVATSA